MSETLEDKYSRIVELAALQTIALEDVRLERDCLKDDLAKAIEFADRLRGDMKQLKADLASESAAHIATGERMDDLDAMLNRIASTVDDYFEPRNEECVADGVDGMSDHLAELEADNVRLRCLLEKTLPILDETARNLTGDPNAYSGLANLIRQSLKG